MNKRDEIFESLAQVLDFYYPEESKPAASHLPETISEVWRRKMQRVLQGFVEDYGCSQGLILQCAELLSRKKEDLPEISSRISESELDTLDEAARLLKKIGATETAAEVRYWRVCQREWSSFCNEFNGDLRPLLVVLLINHLRDKTGRPYWNSVADLVWLFGKPDQSTNTLQRMYRRARRRLSTKTYLSKLIENHIN